VPWTTQLQRPPRASSTRCSEPRETRSSARCARSRGGRADVAEEATAEAFARAITHRSSIRDPIAWIYRVAFRVAVDEIRSEGRRAPQVDASLMPHELHGVMDALRELSPNKRAAVVLRHVEGLETGEVADRMGIAQATVRVHLFRARKRLAQLLGDEEVE
jgi:RNA polymerase sigma factor (sigma-70 family)